MSCAKCHQPHDGTGKCCAGCQASERERQRMRRRTSGVFPRDEFWNTERCERLRELWTARPQLSAAAIAEQLGDGLTRCAVLGKAHRLGLETRKTPTAFTTAEERAEATADRREHYNRSRRKRTAAKRLADDYAHQRPSAAQTESTDLPPDQSDCAVSFMALESHHCRYQVSPDGQPRMFCGAGVEQGHSWCARHCRVVYAPTVRKAPRYSFKDYGPLPPGRPSSLPGQSREEAA